VGLTKSPTWVRLMLSFEPLAEQAVLVTRDTALRCADRVLSVLT
jgi:hypothetical protein